MLSGTVVVKIRRLWWLAAWSIAGMSFAINQLHLFVTWENPASSDAAQSALLNTLVTPTSVLLLAGFCRGSSQRFGTVWRVVL